MMTGAVLRGKPEKKNQKCAMCDQPATKAVGWADGRAYQASCDKHVKDVQNMIVEKNGKMAELTGVTDLAVPSAVYPDLERKPGGPDNWVEKAGGLPDYIERIAKHLHYEKGFTISHAIATAVNTVKRWARKGSVAKYGSTENVTVATQAKAAKALAEWEAKKVAGRTSTRVSLSAILAPSSHRVDLSEVEVDLSALAQRANAIADPVARGEARAKILDMAATTKDGRKSFKKQGKWGHGFVPLDDKAKEAKAKGSPVARKRIDRIFGGRTSGDKAKPSTSSPTKREESRGLAKGGAVTVRTDVGTRKADSATLLRGVPLKDASKTQRVAIKSVANRGRRTRNADKPWDEIPDKDKTIRNGKKYVLTTFQGKVQLTEYTGGVEHVDTTDKANRVYTSITDQALEQFTSGELSRLLEVPGQPPAVKAKIRARLDLVRKENQ